MSLNEMKIAGILKDLNRLAPPLTARINEATKHAKMLRSAESLDARAVLNAATELQKEANAHQTAVKYLTAEVESLARTSAGTKMKGYIANIKGLRQNIGDGLDELHNELLNLAKSANDRLNEPGRYGDAATATGPLKDLIDLVLGIIELVAKYRQKAK